MSTIGYINISLETFGGLISLIFMLNLRIIRPKKELTERRFNHLLICNTVLLFSDAAAWLFKGRADWVSLHVVRISNFLVYTLGYVMLVLFTRYLVSFLAEKGTKLSNIPQNIICALMGVAVGLTILSQLNGMYYLIDMQNIYHRQAWFWVSQMFGVIGMCFNGGLLVLHRKGLSRKELWAFASYITLPATALLLQILFYGIAVLYLATTICLLCIYISIQTELVREIGQKELELEKNRSAIMLSQIQPHFLYNTLLGIKQLCDEDPQRASDALEHFSYYLRGNLDSLADTQLISFEKELSHVQDYLYLEKMRFSDKLNIVWELGYEEFLLPSLTLQPIVENAVRHGIIKKKDGGRLTIKSEKVADNVVITVSDTGVGFDTNRKKDDGRSHIGIENVRNRLKIQCGGSLLIQSENGVGTQARIVLPQK